MSSFGKSGGGGRRKAARAQAPLLAVLSTVGGDHRAALVNVSSTGARLSAPQLPPAGEVLIFRADNIQSFGHVVWSENGQCGVEFEAPIAASNVIYLREQASRWSGFGWSTDEKAAAEEWGLGVAR
jgi:PilZ domain-containing protein